MHATAMGTGRDMAWPGWLVCSLIVAIAVLAACEPGGSGASPSSAATSQQPLPIPSAIATERPSASDSLKTLELSDVGFRLRYPIDWFEISVPTLRVAWESRLKQSTGAIKAATQATIDQIDRGELRAGLFSPRTADGFIESMIVYVEDARDADAAAAAIRRAHSYDAVVPAVRQDVTPVDMAVGQMQLLDRYTAPSGGAPSHQIDYITVLADGRTLTLAGTGPTSDISFAETMRLMVETLSLE